MNTATHFFTGYLLGRLLGNRNNTFKNDHFIPFFMGIVAILPDIDGFLHLIIPIHFFEHAMFSHTIIGALLFTLIYTVGIWGVGKKVFKKMNISPLFLLSAALIAISSHLILDIFTYREDIYTTDAHLYFWPLWNASFHLNLFFHQSIYSNIYLVRILIEVIYSMFLIVIILFYGWFYKKESPFAALIPRNWIKYIDSADKTDVDQKRAYALFGISFAVVILIIFPSFWVF